MNQPNLCKKNTRAAASSRGERGAVKVSNQQVVSITVETISKWLLVGFTALQPHIVSGSNCRLLHPSKLFVRVHLLCTCKFYIIYLCVLIIVDVTENPFLLLMYSKWLDILPQSLTLSTQHWYCLVILEYVKILLGNNHQWRRQQFEIQNDEYLPQSETRDYDILEIVVQ